MAAGWKCKMCVCNSNCAEGVAVGVAAGGSVRRFVFVTVIE